MSSYAPHLGHAIQRHSHLYAYTSPPDPSRPPHRGLTATWAVGQSLRKSQELWTRGLRNLHIEPAFSPPQFPIAGRIPFDTKESGRLSKGYGRSMDWIVVTAKTLMQVKRVLATFDQTPLLLGSSLNRCFEPRCTNRKKKARFKSRQRRQRPSGSTQLPSQPQPSSRTRRLPPPGRPHRPQQLTLGLQQSVVESPHRLDECPSQTNRGVEWKRKKASKHLDIASPAKLLKAHHMAQS